LHQIILLYGLLIGFKLFENEIHDLMLILLASVVLKVKPQLDFRTFDKR